MFKTPQERAIAAKAPQKGVSAKKPRKAPQKTAMQGVNIDAAHKLPKKNGRPSKYTPELAAEICYRLSNGEPLRQICRDDHMPAWTAVYAWGAKDAELSERIARAREAGQDAIAEEVYALVEREPERILSEGGGRVDAGYVQWIRVQADIKLKLLAKWNPKRYGDRVAVSGVEGGAAIKVDHGIFDVLLTNIELKRQVVE